MGARRLTLLKPHSPQTEGSEVRRTELLTKSNCDAMTALCCQCSAGILERMSRANLMCNFLPPQQITSEMNEIVWIFEIDCLCMQQYHPLQRAQSCQCKPNQPHQQQWTWWQTA